MYLSLAKRVLVVMLPILIKEVLEPSYNLKFRV